MGLSIDGFRARVSEGGKVGLQDNAKDGLKTFANTLGGKVVAFFRGVFKPGTVAKENRNVMNAFITTLKHDDNYGAEFAKLAETSLAPLKNTGKALSARKLGEVFQQLDAHREQNLGMARGVAEFFTSGKSGEDTAFNRIFENMTKDKDLPTDPALYATQHLRESITSRIMERSENGTRGVGLSEGSYLAKGEIDMFLCRCAMEVDSKGEHPITNGPFTKEQQSVNLKNAQDLGNELSAKGPGKPFADMFQSVAESMGMPGDMSKYDLTRLLRDVAAKVGHQSQLGRHVVSREEGITAATREIAKFLTMRKGATEFAEKVVPGGGQDTQALKEVVTMSTSKIKSIDYVRGVANMRGRVDEIMRAFAEENPSRLDLYTALNKMQSGMQKDLEAALGRDFGAPELTAFLRDCLRYAMKTSTMSETDMRRVVDNMACKECKDLRGVLMTTMYDPSVGTRQGKATSKAFNQSNTIMTRLAEEMQDRLSVPDETMQEAMYPTDFAPKDFPTDLREAMTRDGFHLPVQ